MNWMRSVRDVFLMGYWGYRSPWWLLHADTLFDSGMGIEAASPSDQPAAYARDSVTQKLDQAQWRAVQVGDVPVLGKDSLGVWLSDWGWNSQIGKERWENGFVMDICRGSLLAQPWSDAAWLSPPERKQMAEFIALLKARPECFGNPRFILGDPNEERTLRLLLHGRKTGIPGVKQFLLEGQPVDAGTQLRLGTVRRSNVGPLPLVSRRGETSGRGGGIRRKGLDCPAPL